MTDLEDFARAAKALTSSGQVKESSVRHRKDDSFRLDDRLRYVLGWSNEPKIAAMDAERIKLEAGMRSLTMEMEAVEKQRDGASLKRENIAFLSGFRSYDELDWEACERTIARYRMEKQELESASDKLGELRRQLSDAEKMLAATEESLSVLQREIIRTESKMEQDQKLRAVAETLLAPVDEAAAAKINDIHIEVASGASLSVDSCESQENSVRTELQRRIDAEEKRQSRARERILLAMQTFRTAYPTDTSEFDAAVEAQAEYRKLLEQLRFHDLPRFELRFREELRKNTIDRIAMFHAKLDEHSKEIEGRIRIINDSLVEIEYNRDRYIELLQQSSFNSEVQQFRADLRACTDHELHGHSDDQYAEVKFEQVKRILDRLRVRQESASEDRRWRTLVTDVRNWFQFSASERWREDDREHEHYSDSSGKSGGQKEKLAYTVLAASLAYQFGLEWIEDRSRPFRFVLIDEAFGRGSDESAEFGLNLFRKLNLQLMIVTPLQKIHVIEPYVASVAFVENRTGNSSSVLVMSIEEHRRQKTARAS